MNRAGVFVSLALLSIPIAADAQASTRLSYAPEMMLSEAVPDPMGAPVGMGAAGGAAGGGQVEYSATRGGAFSLGGVGLAISTLGIGAEFATNVTPRLDLRGFGNYTRLGYDFSRSGFGI